MLKYALVVIALLIGYIGFQAWRGADKLCDTRIEKIVHESDKQVIAAHRAAQDIAASDDLVALCLRDKYCRSK